MFGGVRGPGSVQVCGVGVWVSCVWVVALGFHALSMCAMLPLNNRTPLVRTQVGNPFGEDITRKSPSVDSSNGPAKFPKRSH